MPSVPRPPLAPVLSAASLLPRGRAPLPCVLDAGAVRHVTSGRIAIGLALQALSIGPGDVVLVPAYHSRSMIGPVVWRGATPQFYRVRENAAVDLEHLASMLHGAVKAVMVTHYFGIPQDMAPIRALCDARGVALLEDCAHAFFGAHGGRPLGAWGDYAIASSMKFFPMYEGGCLISARHALDALPLRGAGAAFEAKVMLTTLETSFSFGRLALAHALLWAPLAAKDALWRRVKARQATPAPALAPSSSDSSYDFDARWLDKRSARFSQAVLRLASKRRIVALRRARYLRLHAALQSLPGCRPLIDALPEQACPWVFPLRVDDPEALFARLHAAGVPITRFADSLWPGVDASVCPHSARLSRHVLCFPVHQELRERELAWMIDTIVAAARA
ncbi:MAG: aminotransferase class I/II-fold pyridoxal phosphate-dependent enzyme [Gammaproteobacteria bacterium]